MSRPGSITVSRSKRGTTVKASGAAAQVLFDALTSRYDAGLALQRPAPHTIHFEDHGQDFLEWDVDARGVVTDCRPFQAHVWCGAVLVNDAALGQCVTYMFPTDKRERSIRYPVLKVVRVLTAVPAPADKLPP